MTRTMGVAPISRASANALDLDALLQRMQERWSWPVRARRYEVVNRWNSRTAVLYRCRGEGGEPDVVVKVVDDVGGYDAREMAEAMQSLDRVLAAGGRTTVRIVPALGWDEAAPSVCTRHIDGTDIFFMFKDLDHPAWAQTGWAYDDLVVECGRCLGAFHHGEGNDPVPQDPSRAGSNDLGAAARAVGISARKVAEIEPRVAMAPRFGDFGPHQFRLATDGRLYLLDTPVAHVLAPVHGDIAQFVFGLVKILGDATRGGRRRRRRLAPELIEAFYRGYAEAAPIDPRGPNDRRIIGFFLGRAAAGIAHKRLREGRVLAAIRHGIDWAREVVAARRTLPDT